MNENEIYNALHRGGAFSLPYLMKLEHPTHGALYFVNNNVSITYNGNTYAASTFKYNQPKTIGGVLKNGSLEITAIDNNIIDLIEQSNEQLTVTAVGIIDSGGTVTPIKTYLHKYCTVTTDNNMKITINFQNDDRLNMTFPPYIFDADNNAGNA